MRATSNILRAAMFAIMSLLAAAAQAAPASGYWWNPAEGGRGYVVEVQGSSMFFAGFLYDVSGRATWVASNGNMASGTRYSGQLVGYSGGQTLNGAYQPATQGPSLGNVALNFSDSTHATLTWPGGTLPIQRYDFGPGGAGATQPANNPQTGYWWNSAEGGRGYTIEVQGGSMYLAGYMYDANGNPLWYLASGPVVNSITGSGSTFQGAWTQYGNGQTLTGAFQPASIVNANVGAITLQFSDTANAVLTLPNGRQIPLTRFMFGNGGTSAANVQPMVVDAGPTGNDANVAFVSVTICAPGTGNCQTIDHIDVDTGSAGLRIISSVLSPALASALGQQVDTSGRPIVECTQFADGFVWGPVKLADFSIAGEQVKSLPIQVIADPAFANTPADCSNTGPSEGTVDIFGANGIIGVGVFQADCGSLCAGSAIPGTYYVCQSGTCTGAATPVAQQVQNPVGLFAVDNNGVILQLPAIPASGQATAAGSLIFGIGTQANNGLGNAMVLTVSPNTGYLRTIYDAKVYADSFVDSGSSAYFLPAGIVQACPASYAPYFCPSSPVNLTATLQATNGAMANVNFSIGNAQTLATNAPTFAAFSNLGAQNGDSFSFDFGLPFFYGRSVYSAIEGKATPGGTGPYVAF